MQERRIIRGTTTVTYGNKVRVQHSGAEGEKELVIPFNALPTAVALSTDGTRIAVGTISGAAHIYTVEGANVDSIASAEPQAPPQANAYAPFVTALVFNPEDTLLVVATSGSAIHVWDVAARDATQPMICIATKTTSAVTYQLSVCSRLSPTAAMVHITCVSSNDHASIVSIDIAKRRDLTQVLALSNIENAQLPCINTASWSVAKANYQGKSIYLATPATRAPLSEAAITRSAEVAVRLNHPHLWTPIAEVQNDDRRVCGLAFDGHLPIETMPIGSSTLHLAHLAKVAETLQFLHDRNCVHNNICYEKVLVSNGMSLIWGFEYASAPGMEKPDIPDSLNGYFCAPEWTDVNSERVGTQASGVNSERVGTQASDVYSFGKLLLFTLYQGKPLAALHARDVAAGIITSCCQTDPAERPTISIVASSLERLLLDLLLPSKDAVSAALFGERGLIHNAPKDMYLELLPWRQEEGVLLATAEPEHPCYKFVRGYLGDVVENMITRIDMVGTDSVSVRNFLDLHNNENSARMMNAFLQAPNSPSSKRAIKKLKESFVDTKRTSARARLLLAWHGTPIENVLPLCRDKPRNVHTRDAGYFGSGSYFALEAAYAARYTTSPGGASSERAIVLFALSVSQLKAITLDDDYCEKEDPATPTLHGFSKYYSGNPNVPRALAPGYDGHFIPVRNYRATHPRNGSTLQHVVGHQACGETDTPEAHEIVIGSHIRCIPLAVVYFKAPQQPDRGSPATVGLHSV